ncbi:excalibur calcium-binding domain-containing protein [Nocardioides cynanchi]|uniref:excalibur calcium-binding domain-containing protein n=1 Tax=Nocardioides cynanchi TaxID=2558918 RepID=UPI001246EF6E|nr:excalibur calcium-binding domain-containing protein [Nocardioides cynanchi]
MKKIIAAAAATIALAPLAMVASPAEASGRYFANCTALRHAWHHGVAKGPVAAAYQVRQGNPRPAYGPSARAVYATNYTRLDRDRDGTACEG